MRVRDDNNCRKVTFRKAVPNFVWHSCVHCKKVFRSKFEVIRHKREEHVAEMKLALQNARTESDDDEPAIVTVTTMTNNNEKQNDGDIEEYVSPKSSTSSCSSSSLSSSSYSVIKYTQSSPPPTRESRTIPISSNNNPHAKSQQSNANPRNKHGTTTNNNSRVSSSPPVTTTTTNTHVDNSDQSNLTNETSLLIVKQDRFYSHDPLKSHAAQVETRSAKQLLHRFLRKNNKNNNSYTCPSGNKHKSPSDEVQLQETMVLQKRRRHSQETLPTSSTSSFPQGLGQCSSKQTPETVRNTAAAAENNQPSPSATNNLSIISTNTKGGQSSASLSSSSHQAQSNCKVLRRLLSNRNLEPPKLKEYTQRPPTVNVTPHRTISKAFANSQAFILPKPNNRDTQEGQTTKSFQSLNPPTPHQTTTTPKQQLPLLSCLICRVPFLEKQSLAEHLDSVHLSSAKFHCQICTEPFDRRESYERHILGTTCRTEYMCSYCFLHFPSLHELKFHERTHRGPTPYSCKFCRLPFETVACLMSHLVVHSNDEEFEYI